MTATEIFDALAKIGGFGALMVTAGAAIYRFRNQRPYAPRLEITVLGELMDNGGETFLCLSTRAKNTGSTKIDLHPKGKAVKISVARSTNSAATQITPELIDTFDVFKKDAWLEPTEAIEDLLLVRVDKSKALAFYAEVILTSAAAPPKDVQWSQTGVVYCASKVEEADSKQ